MGKLNLIIRAYCQARNIILDIIYFGRILRRNNKSTKKFNPPHASDYLILDEILDKVNLKQEDILLDVGSGYGRVLLYLAKKIKGINLIGCEIDEIVYLKSSEYLKTKKRIKLYNKNILEFECSANYIFMFNPLSKYDFDKFLKAVAAGQFGYKPTIIYLGNENFSTIEKTKPVNMKIYKFERALNIARGGQYIIFNY